MVKHIGIILARGGSKRLPGKNIHEIHGKHMLGWTVEAALQSGQYKRVLVSTDDPEIAEIGRSFGAEAPFLRDAATGDLARSSEATLAALAQAEHHWNEQYDYVSQLMANCPLRDEVNISAAVANFINHKAEAQISCFQFGWMNPWWAVKLDAQKRPEYLFPEARATRSQDLPPLYCPTGAIWIAKSSVLKEEKTFYAKNCIFHPMDWMSAMDIDDTGDLEMAKALFLDKEKRASKANADGTE